MFGHKKETDINKALYTTFCKKYKPKTTEKPLEAIKAIEPTVFPPCRNVLLEQIKRTFFICTLYKNAHLSDPSCGLLPINWGFDMDQSGKYIIRWFEGEQVPGEFEDIVDDLLIEDDEMNGEESDGESDGEGLTLNFDLSYVLVYLFFNKLAMFI